MPSRCRPERSPTARRHRLLLFAGCGAVAILAGVAVFSATSGTRAEREADQAPALIRQADRIVIPAGSPYLDRIVVAGVATKTVNPTLVLPAAVEAEPARTVNILPPVTGKVSALMVQLGDQVAQGQPLAVIDSSDLAQAYADHDKAAEALRLTTQVLDRARALMAARGGALKDQEQAESDHAQAQAEFDRSQARLQDIGATAEVNGRRVLTLRAPVSGSVIALATAPGAYANDSTLSLMTIANLDQVWVTANAPESDVAFVKPGMAVDVTFPAYPGQRFQGTVASVSALLDPDTRRTKVRIAFANGDGKFKPNMFANATFMAPPLSELVVPTSALLMDNDRITVFVEVAPHTFERRDVEEGREDGGYARIRRGLAAGERVVVRGGVLLND